MSPLGDDSLGEVMIGAHPRARKVARSGRMVGFCSISRSRSRAKRGGGPATPYDPGVNCPYCDSNKDKVIDSRESEGGKVIRRRRECLSCGKRFTTYERIESTVRLVVIKKDGTHVPFNRDNVLRGVQSACGKRPIPEAVKERLVDEIEEGLHRDFEREVESREIGERVMLKLRDLDEVAYIRFASEYYNFKSVDEIKQQLQLLDARTRDVKDQQRLF